jgi:hypothetical protein
VQHDFGFACCKFSFVYYFSFELNALNWLERISGPFKIQCSHRVYARDFGICQFEQNKVKLFYFYFCTRNGNDMEWFHLFISSDLFETFRLFELSRKSRIYVSNLLLSAAKIDRDQNIVIKKNPNSPFKFVRKLKCINFLKGSRILWKPLPFA